MTTQNRQPIFRAFLSSSRLDLQPERSAVAAALQGFPEIKFIGMEYFGSRNATPVETSLDEVEGCDLYIGIIGFRYGSGITQAEYQKARQLNIDCLIYLKETTGALPLLETNSVDEALLGSFKADLKNNHIVSEFSGPDNLAALVGRDVHRWLRDKCSLKVTQISTGDAVFGTLTQSGSLLSRFVRTKETQSLVAEKTKEFVGREFVFNAIDRLFTDHKRFPSGYVVIRGEPGIGKTALSAQLVRLRGYVHHFNVVSQNIRSSADFLGSICAQLIIRYGLNYIDLPPHAIRNSGFLSQLLSEVSAQVSNRPVVVVVDALDEAEEELSSPMANRLFLPQDLPEGVFFVVTTREKHTYRLDVARREDIRLEDTSPQNLADVGQYIHKFISDRSETMERAISQWEVKKEEFVDIITSKSQGNFMYLVYVLRDIDQALLTRDNVETIHHLPVGLREYYQRHWRTMRLHYPERFNNYYEPVICMLATARAPVSVAEVLEWTRARWPHLNPMTIQDVIREWREFLNEDCQDTFPPLYRIYHSSFQEFLKEEVGLTLFREQIALNALRKIPGMFPRDRDLFE